MLPLIFLTFGFALGLASMACLFIGKLLGDWTGQWFHVSWIATVFRFAGIAAGIALQGGGAMLLYIPISMLQGTERRNKGLPAAAYFAGAAAGLYVGFLFLRAHW